MDGRADSAWRTEDRWADWGRADVTTGRADGGVEGGWAEGGRTDCGQHADGRADEQAEGGRPEGGWMGGRMAGRKGGLTGKWTAGQVGAGGWTGSKDNLEHYDFSSNCTKRIKKKNIVFLKFCCCLASSGSVWQQVPIFTTKMKKAWTEGRTGGRTAGKRAGKQMGKRQRRNRTIVQQFSSNIIIKNINKHLSFCIQRKRKYWCLQLKSKKFAKKWFSWLFKSPRSARTNFYI